MKIMKTVFVLLIAAGVVLAQPPKGAAKKKATASMMAAQAPKAPAAPKMAPKAAMQKPAKPAAAAATGKRPMAPKAAKPVAKAAERAKRDPFVSPVVARSAVVCTGGKRCLEIGQLTIQGVVKTPQGMIAMVQNPAKKVYFLTENDALYDGVVTKIVMGTPEHPMDHRGDKVVFKQEVVDPLGNKSMREIVKVVAGPA